MMMKKRKAGVKVRGGKENEEEGHIFLSQNLTASHTHFVCQPAGLARRRTAREHNNTPAISVDTTTFLRPGFF